MSAYGYSIDAGDRELIRSGRNGSNQYSRNSTKKKSSLDHLPFSLYYDPSTMAGKKIDQIVEQLKKCARSFFDAPLVYDFLYHPDQKMFSAVYRDGSEITVSPQRLKSFYHYYLAWVNQETIPVRRRLREIEQIVPTLFPEQGLDWQRGAQFCLSNLRAPTISFNLFVDQLKREYLAKVLFLIASYHNPWLNYYYSELDYLSTDKISLPVMSHLDIKIYQQHLPSLKELKVKRGSGIILSDRKEYFLPAKYDYPLIEKPIDQDDRILRVPQEYPPEKVFLAQARPGINDRIIREIPSFSVELKHQVTGQREFIFSVDNYLLAKESTEQVSFRDWYAFYLLKWKQGYLLNPFGHYLLKYHSIVLEFGFSYYQYDQYHLELFLGG